MPTILVVENDKTLETVYSMNLSIYVGAEVLGKTDLESALELLKKHEHIALIISKPIINEKKVALEIYRFLNQEERSIPMVVTGEENLLEKYASVLGNEPEVKDVIREAARALGITPRDMLLKEVPDYYPIPIIFFTCIQRLICPVYIRIRDPGGKDDQYVKRYHPDSRVSLDEIQDFLKRGIKYLYVPKEARLKLTNNVTSEMLKTLKNQNINDDERIQATSTGVELVREAMQTAGLSPETIELAKTTIKSMKKLVSSSPKLKDLLEKLLSNTGTYLYKHTQLLTFVAFHAISNLEWGSEEQQDKLAFCALFHDITLPHDDLAIIHSDEALNTAKLKDQDKYRVTTHALDAARLVQNFPRTPIGADVIIKQHHGSLGGTGFPKQYSNNLSPLAIVFIIAEEFAHYLLNVDKSQQSRDVLIARLFEKYPKNMYKRVIRTLENLDIT